MQSATGSGKTMTFCHILKHEAGASVAIAHRSELVTQMSLTLARYGVRHRVIGPNAVARQCAALHLAEIGRDYTDSRSKTAVAGVDTLIRMSDSDPWFKQVGLVVQDEGHHGLRENKWGRAASMFPNARGLYPTATPCRSDKKGLGRHADGLIDAMVLGPSMRWLIENGFLTDYRVFAPKSDIDISKVAISQSTGDFNLTQLRSAVHESRQIVGDVVKHYLRIAPGKLGATFCVDVEEATKVAAAYRAAGVPAEVITGNTPPLLRAELMRRFRNRDILQLVSVDILGEGVDVPAIEVVTMARHTASFGLFCLDPLTEVLTPEGWLKSEQALQAKNVLAFDLHTGAVSNVDVTGRVCRPMYEDESMYRLVSPHCDLLVSDKHNLIVKSRTPTAKNWQIQTAEQVADRTAMYAIPVAGHLELPDCGLTDDELKFLGWFMSDGTLNKNTNSIQISQSVAKPNHIQHIADSIRGCGFKFGLHLYRRKNVPSTHNDSFVFSISKGEPRGTDKHLSGWARLGQWVDKSVPAIYDTLSARDLRVMLEAWNLGDGFNNHSCIKGYKVRSMRIACGSDKNMADRLQQLCVTRGLRCNISVQSPRGVDWYTCNIKEVTHTTVAGKNVKDGSISGKKDYERSRLEKSNERPDYVWCLSNELGTLITRRNGKVAIVGNCQQFGRALRPMEGKSHAIIIDHVGNFVRHGPPDAPQNWTLDRGERRRSSATDAESVRVCDNVDCLAAYPRRLTRCPYCEQPPTVAGRSAPEYVDGDLHELDASVLAHLRGEIERIDGAATLPLHLDAKIQRAVFNRHAEKQEAQRALRQTMALWGGYWVTQGETVRVAQKRFYLTWGIDVMTAQTLGVKDATALRERIVTWLNEQGVKGE